jgi:hypothetical protein
MSAKKPAATITTKNPDEERLKAMEKKIDDRYKEAEKARDSGDVTTFNRVSTELKPEIEKLEKERAKVRGK